MEKNYLPEQVTVPVKTPGAQKAGGLQPPASHPWRKATRVGVAKAAARKAAALPVAAESTEQKALFSWARTMEGQRPELKMMLSIPNGAHCGEISRMRLVSEGLRAGAPDVMLPVARGCYHGLALELKRESGGVLRPEQALFLLSLWRGGWYAVVCRGAQDAIDTVTAYLDLGEFAAGGAALGLPSPDAVGEFFRK